MFSFRQLKYFVVAAEVGQISQAAVELNITQSAVTTAIRELESLLNTQLFKRLPQGVVLTDTGRRFLNHAYGILSSVNEAMLLANWEEHFTGKLSIAASYTVIGYFLPAHLKRLASLYPELEIQLFELPREEIEEGLLQNKYDVAVLLSSNVDNPNLMVEPIISSQRRLWLPAQHSLLEKQTATLADVANEPYIMLTVDEAENTTMRYWQHTLFRPRTIFRTSSIEGVRSMVANGMGVAVLSDMVYRPWSLEGRRINTVMLQDHIPSMVLGLAWSPQSMDNPLLQLLREYFHHQFMS